jgi:hypothetical protein
MSADLDIPEDPTRSYVYTAATELSLFQPPATCALPQQAPGGRVDAA